MAALFKRIMRAGLTFGTRRLMREAMASAIAMLVVTVAFTGVPNRPEAPVTAPAVAAAPAPRLVVVAAGPSVDEVAKTWFDPTLVEPGAHGFHRTAAVAKPAHRRAAAARPVLVTSRSVVPSRRPIEARAATHVQMSLTPVTLTEVAQAPAPEEHGFQVFGLAPGDLVPSPSGVMHNVKSFAGAIAGLANGF